MDNKRSRNDKIIEKMNDIAGEIFSNLDTADTMYRVDNKGGLITEHIPDNMVSSKDMPIEMVPSLKEPPSILAKRVFFKQVKENYSKYSGFDINEIISKVKKYKDNAIEYYDWMYKRAAEIFKNNKIDDFIEMRCICDVMDNIYLQINSKRFVIDVDADNVFELLSVDGLTKKTSKSIIDIDPMKNIRDIEDSIFDFRDSNGLYIPVFYRINQVTFTVDYGKYKGIKPINFCGIMWRNELSDDLMKSIVIFEGLILPEIYPKLLLLRETYPLCDKNDKPSLCIKRDISLYENEISPLVNDTLNDKFLTQHINTPICQMTPNLAIGSHCPMLMANPWVILKYLSYAWDMYSHRNSIMHKNSKRKAGYTHNKVHVASTDKNDYDYSIVPLHTYYDTERKNHEWKGGTHSSPCEHERAASYRRIFNKDGTVKKIVPVKGCTVNAGNQKTEIVKIKAPKRKED